MGRKVNVLLGAVLLALVGALAIGGTNPGKLVGSLFDHRHEPAAVGNRMTPRDSSRETSMSVESNTHGEVVHIGESDFDQQVLKSSVPVLVDFYADWCGPCQALAPVLQQIAREMPSAKVVKVNVDDAPDLAMRYGVSAIPTLLVFKNGQVATQLVGMASKSRLKSALAL
jgi:thioredoxin 1